MKQRLIVRLTVVDAAANPADVPDTLTGWAPVGLELAVFRVSVVLVVLVSGEKVAVTPDGSPLALNATAPVKPFTPLTVIVYAALLLCETLRLVGEADSEKLAGGGGGAGATGPTRGAVAGSEVAPSAAVTITVTKSPASAPVKV